MNLLINNLPVNNVSLIIDRLNELNIRFIVHKCNGNYKSLYIKGLDSKLYTKLSQYVKSHSVQ